MGSVLTAVSGIRSEHIPLGISVGYESLLLWCRSWLSWLKPVIFSSNLFSFRRFGIMGLYKGLEAKLLQTVLTAALMFLVYEKLTATTFTVMGLKSAHKHWDTSHCEVQKDAPDGGFLLCEGKWFSFYSCCVDHEFYRHWLEKHRRVNMGYSQLDLSTT